MLQGFVARAVNAWAVQFRVTEAGITVPFAGQVFRAECIFT
jgi:hypothetical protein